MCVAIKRVFVHESRYEEMVDAMKAEAAKAKDATGDGLDEETKFGPINNRMQLARVRAPSDPPFPPETSISFTTMTAPPPMFSCASLHSLPKRGLTSL